MLELTESTIHCPYCGEPNQVLLDPGEAGHSYIEDCQVCCRPMIFVLSAMGSAITAEVYAEDEQAGG
jgi:hypothetical protein